MSSTSRRRLWITLLSLTALVNQFSVNVIRPATTYKVDAMGGDATLVGVIAAAYAIIPLLSAMSVGRLVQRLPTLAGLMATGLLVIAIGAGAIAASPAVVGLIAGTAALGFGQLVFTIGGQSAVSRVSGDAKMDSGFGWFTAGVSAGQMLGPLAAGWIISSADTSAKASMSAINLSIWIGSAVTVPAAVVLFITLLPRRHRKIPVAQPNMSTSGPRRVKTSTLQILRRPRVGTHIIASAGLLALTDILVAFVPLLGESVGLSPTLVGTLLAVRGIGSLASRLMLGYLTARIRRETLLITSLFVSAACFGALPPVVGTIWLAGTLMFLGGFSLGLGQPLTMSMIALTVPTPWRAPALALRLVGNRLGQVVIPLTAGTVAAPAGPGSAIWLGGAVLVVSAIQQSRHRPTQS